MLKLVASKGTGIKIVGKKIDNEIVNMMAQAGAIKTYYIKDESNKKYKTRREIDYSC